MTRDLLRQLFDQRGAQVIARATPAEIDSVERQFQKALPDWLRELWTQSNGVIFEKIDAHILGPAEVKQVSERDIWQHRFIERGLLPMLDDRQSNYLAVVLSKPLAFRIAYLPHDDGHHLLYRDFDGLVKGIITAHKKQEWAGSFFHLTKGDYAPQSPRSESDRIAGKALLKLAGSQAEWPFAVIQLLGEGDVEEWKQLLETDERRDVWDRLEHSQSPVIQALLQENRQAVKTFADLVTQSFKNAGLAVGRRDGEHLQVAGQWVNLGGFFSRRNIPDAIQRMIAWIEDGNAGRNPYDRPGNYFTDV